MKRALALTACALAFAACSRQPAAPPPPRGPEKLLVPEKGAYTGAFIDFGDTEDDVTVEGIEAFEKMVGKHQAIVASSSYWGEQCFPTANLLCIWRHGSIPLVYWSPWDRPYDEDQGPDKFSLVNIAAGKWDAYIDHWGDAAAAFGHPFMVSFANEMNGQWFPWSGMFYGQDKVIPGTKPPKYVAPEIFKAAYRRVVDRVRARGATNVVWVFHAMNYSMPQAMGGAYPAAMEWNKMGQYYPGPKYVDWLGMSVYGQQYVEDNWSPFEPLLDWPYTEITTMEPNKPVMLAEWGIGEFPQFGSKSGFITEAFNVMKRYPKLKAAVFWNERWQNEPSYDDNGIYHDGGYSDLRVNSTPASLAAYRKGVGEPFWLGFPLIGH
ncbi:MAG TPA: glycosyl hydrolase [Chthoniobacteraceae bacterium]|jgi:beta-mannanase|nr:glycosyl hydrolase [Chthoniobacteraceae bacterium]